MGKSNFRNLLIDRFTAAIVCGVIFFPASIPMLLLRIPSGWGIVPWIAAVGTIAGGIIGWQRLRRWIGNQTQRARYFIARILCFPFAFVWLQLSIYMFMLGRTKDTASSHDLVIAYFISLSQGTLALKNFLAAFGLALATILFRRYQAIKWLSILCLFIGMLFSYEVVFSKRNTMIDYYYDNLIFDLSYFMAPFVVMIVALIIPEAVDRKIDAFFDPD